MSNDYLSKHRVTTFFVLTFFISWGAILILFGMKAIPATEDLQEKIGISILLGPPVSSLLLIVYYDGIEGLRQLGSKLLKWRSNIKWYALALLTAPLSTLLSIFISGYRPAIFNSNDVSGLLLLGVLGGLMVGIFEELGWTGFAVPHLIKKFSIMTTGLIVGVLWGTWHFILFWEEESFQETVPFLLLLTRLFAWLPAYRILMVWVYQNTQSLLIIILMHASLVASIAALDPIINGEDLLIYILLRALVLWSIIPLIAVIKYRRTIMNKYFKRK